MERYSPEFIRWMVWMLDLYDRSRLGWHISNDDLSLEEWRALAVIHKWYDMRREDSVRRLWNP